ncbi:unnamed protein product [Blepharisma stoltei]|uniref:Uncharacterized protein n=1 Tax=Blepharisma stoltei TaxID=1481888 RepID=A0AAU9J202_9CILI|nr:unnamed protein product [Blepharisma stoltei]
MGCKVSLNREIIIKNRPDFRKCKNLKKALCTIRDLKFNLKPSTNLKEELFEINEVCSLMEESDPSRQMSEVGSSLGVNISKLLKK